MDRHSITGIIWDSFFPSKNIAQYWSHISIYLLNWGTQNHAIQGKPPES